MAVKDLIVKEIGKVPESYHAEILDFIYFLETKKQKMETMIARESALRKDWLRPEEDEAWRDL